MSTFADFLTQLAGISTFVLDTAEADEFLTNTDKVLDQYKRILTENVAVPPTAEDISRYYIYYAAYTKRNAINGNVEWDTADVYPMEFEEYTEKAATSGWSFLRNSVGIPIKEWNIIIPEPEYNDDWGYTDEDDYDGEGGTY